MRLYTIGHSTRPLEEFLALLEHHRIELLADVRTIPASRQMPHFTKAALEQSLKARSIAYRHVPELGGLRKPRPDSINTGLRNPGFRGYADYMQQEEFWNALHDLEAAADGRRVAVVCAEAVPWRCHRSLISDALTARGVEVRHILGFAEPAIHMLNRLALAVRGRISYPAPDTLPL